MWDGLSVYVWNRIVVSWCLAILLYGGVRNLMFGRRKHLYLIVSRY